MSRGVDNIIVVPVATCRGRSTGIDDDRFKPTLVSTMYINGSIVLSRGVMCALGPHALMCAKGMILQALRKGNIGGGTAKAATHTRTAGRSMHHAAMVVDNSPAVCNCGGGLTDRGIPAGWNMEGQVRTLRRIKPSSSEYCRGGHTPVKVVVNVDFASVAQ